jgi:hypothetical protein
LNLLVRYLSAHEKFKLQVAAEKAEWGSAALSGRRHRRQTACGAFELTRGQRPGTPLALRSFGIRVCPPPRCLSPDPTSSISSLMKID